MMIEYKVSKKKNYYVSNVVIDKLHCLKRLISMKILVHIMGDITKYWQNGSRVLEIEKSSLVSGFGISYSQIKNVLKDFMDMDIFDSVSEDRYYIYLSLCEDVFKKVMGFDGGYSEVSKDIYKIKSKYVFLSLVLLMRFKNTVYISLNDIAKEKSKVKSVKLEFKRAQDEIVKAAKEFLNVDIRFEYNKKGVLKILLS